MARRNSDSNSASGSDFDSEAPNQSPQDLLALLEAQCAGAMGIQPAKPPQASSSKRTLDEQHDEEDGDEDSDGGWSGISEDDAETAKATTAEDQQQPAVIEFSDPTRGPAKQASGNSDYKQFMVRNSAIPTQTTDLTLPPSQRLQSSSTSKLLNQKPQTAQSAKGRQKKDDESSDEESVSLGEAMFTFLELTHSVFRDMKHLDATLQRLISTIPESGASQVEHSGFKKINHSIQQNTPLPLRLALQKTRLKRTKQQVAEAKEAGLLRARSKNAEEPALTQHEKRLRDGSDARRKREARGIGGVVGQMVGGATTLRLSKNQIQAVNAGRGHELQQARRPDKHKSKKTKRR